MKITKVAQRITTRFDKSIMTRPKMMGTPCPVGCESASPGLNMVELLPGRKIGVNSREDRRATADKD